MSLYRYKNHVKINIPRTRYPVHVKGIWPGIIEEEGSIMDFGDITVFLWGSKSIPGISFEESTLWFSLSQHSKNLIGLRWGTHKNKEKNEAPVWILRGTTVINTSKVPSEPISWMNG